MGGTGMSWVAFRRISGKLGPGGSCVAAKAYSASSSIRPGLSQKGTSRAFPATSTAWAFYEDDFRGLVSELTGTLFEII